MSYFDKFSETIDIDPENEVQRLVIKVLMQNGEIRFRESFIEVLEKEVAEYLEEVDSEPNMEWVEGVRYVTHLLKNLEVTKD